MAMTLITVMPVTLGAVLVVAGATRMVSAEAEASPAARQRQRAAGAHGEESNRKECRHA